MQKSAKENKKSIKYIKSNKQGITLVALVVTIIVLLILAGVTITSLLGDNGIIKKAQEAVNKMNDAIQSEQAEINALIEELDDIIAGNGGTGTGSGEDTGGEDTPEVPTGPNGKPLLSTITTLQTSGNVEAEDSYGNIVTVPQGFKVVEGSSGEEISVPNGVVIEDSAGNQFVWIPVGTVYKNAEQTQTSTIKLGRYTFSTSSPGTPTLRQAAFKGDNESKPSQTYANKVTIDSRYQELTIIRDGVASVGINGLNATAKNLAAFVQSVSDNGGYYIARYEASYGSGTSTSDYKPLSKPSTANSESAMNYEPGTLWNFITQLDAAKVARNMYLNNQDINGNIVGVESDLVNSYAWDTAIVYIQEMGKSNYANANRDTTGNTSLMNTGETGDVACNIYDMAANTLEWTTEYSTNTHSSTAYPCVSRGDYFLNSPAYTAHRDPLRCDLQPQHHVLQVHTLCKVALGSEEVDITLDPKGEI